MYIYKNVLVPTDFSDGSENALNHAIDIAKSMGATIHLVNVIQPVVYPTGIEIAHESLLNLEQDLEDNAKKQLEKIEKRLDNLSINYSCSILTGSADDQIIEYSKSENIDLVVIATHGASGFEHFLFGSTTEKVIRKAKCPVLVVHYK